MIPPKTMFLHKLLEYDYQQCTQKAQKPADETLIKEQDVSYEGQVEGYMDLGLVVK